MRIRLKYIVIIIITLSMMSYLYIKTKSVDLEKHNQITRHFAQFMLIDSTLNQSILEIRQGLLTFYDSTVGKTNQLHQLLTEIETLLQQTQANYMGELQPLINTSVKTLDEKKIQIEKFKSTNAVFTNSLRYLPTATTLLSEKLPLDTQGDVITLLLTEQLRDILIYNYSNDDIILTKFNETNKLLTNVFEKHYKPLLNELDSLQTHASIIIKNKPEIDEIVSTILHTPTSINTNKILTRYLSIHNKKIKQINFYQKALYGLSIILILYVAYILSRLNKTGRALRNTVKDLKYQKLAMDQHAIVSILDPNGSIRYANEKFCQISGYTTEEILNKNHDFIRSDDHPDSFYTEFSNAINSNKIWHGNIRNQNKNAEHYWTDTTLVPFMNEDGKPYQFVVIQTNITDIITATEKLRLQSAALEVAANGIVITDKKANILWGNTAFSKISGYALDEIINRNMSISNSGKQNANFYKTLWDTVLAGKPWHGELINRRKDGSLYPEEQTISPVLDNRGNISHFIAIKQDISKRQLTEEALRRSQKLDAIGQLSGGIAHDFNNQLGITLGYLDILKTALKDDEKLSSYIDISIHSAARCVELTRQLLSFSRKQTTETAVVDINRLLKTQELMIAKSMTPEIEINYVLQKSLWPTKINAGDFQDSILNIAINARDAMHNGGKLTIETKNISIEKDNAKHLSDSNPDDLSGNLSGKLSSKLSGDFVLISISDNGSGMDRETVEHVFEPFFTTKEQGKGTGLGMSMVYGFTQRSNGFVNVDSTLNIGTHISIYLPRSMPALEQTKKYEEHTSFPTGNESILIVDDEPHLLQLAKDILKSLGYTTFLANNAHQAMEVLSTEKDIQLLFSDVVMPGNMNGYQLAKKALEDNPKLKILLTSGYNSEPVIESEKTNLTAELLVKPYDKFELATRIRAVLDKASQPPQQ